MGLTAFSTERAPAAEELFSNGPHLATSAFEIGDPTLDTEDALGLEGNITFSNDAFQFLFNAFYTDYDGFIFETPNGEIEDGLDVFLFLQEDATFYGFEAQVAWHAATIESGWGSVEVHLDAQADLVRGELNDPVNGSDNLPRITPFRVLSGISFESELFEFRTEINYVAEQNRIAGFELPTDDYVLWNAYLTVRPFDNKNIYFDVRAVNIADVDARQHTSFLKDVAPLPGSDFRFSIGTTF